MNFTHTHFSVLINNKWKYSNQSQNNNKNFKFFKQSLLPYCHFVQANNSEHNFYFSIMRRSNVLICTAISDFSFSIQFRVCANLWFFHLSSHNFLSFHFSFIKNSLDWIEIAVFRVDFRFFCRYSRTMAGMVVIRNKRMMLMEMLCSLVGRRCTYRCESIHFAYWFLVNCVIHTRKCNDWMCFLVVIAAIFIPPRFWGSCASAS